MDGIWETETIQIVSGFFFSLASDQIENKKDAGARQTG